MSTTANYYDVPLETFVSAIPGIEVQEQSFTKSAGQVGSYLLLWPRPADSRWAEGKFGVELDFFDEGRRVRMEKGCVVCRNGQFELASALEALGIMPGYWD